MKIIEGKFNKAKIFTDVVEEMALKQIELLCNQEFVKESMIRIMPDVHAGAGCTIGTTMTIKDWNYSAPHGAGRLMSRSEAKNSFTVSEFKKQMKNIYTTSVNAETLDECPMAYKNMEDIISNISESVEILKVIKPIYNFKAGEK